MRYALVVDDSSLIRFQVSEVLQNAGYYVCEADSGHAAYEAFLLWEFDIVVTDLIMPFGDGLQLIERIRRTHRDVPIVVLTSAAGRDYVAQARLAGASGYLLKPLDREALLARVADLAGEPNVAPEACLA